MKHTFYKVLSIWFSLLLLFTTWQVKFSIGHAQYIAPAHNWTHHGLSMSCFIVWWINFLNSEKGQPVVYFLHNMLSKHFDTCTFFVNHLIISRNGWIISFFSEIYNFNSCRNRNYVSFIPLQIFDISKL